MVYQITNTFRVGLVTRNISLSSRLSTIILLSLSRSHTMILVKMGISSMGRWDLAFPAVPCLSLKSFQGAVDIYGYAHKVLLRATAHLTILVLIRTPKGLTVLTHGRGNRL